MSVNLENTEKPAIPSAPAQGNAAKTGDTTYLFGWMLLAGVMAAGAVLTESKAAAKYLIK